MSSDPVLHKDARDDRGAGVRRERLHAALVDLEEALTAPVRDDSRWLERIRASAASMLDTVREHVREAESPEGLLAQIIEDAPWLGPRVAHLRDEHTELFDGAAALAASCDEASVPDQIRDHALALLAQVSRHRHRSADLLYDAYELDIAAAD